MFAKGHTQSSRHRELKQWRRWCWRKRLLKSKLTQFQNFLLLSHVVQFDKCWGVEFLRTVSEYKKEVRAIFTWPWNENGQTKQNGNRAIWLVYRTDTNARGFWLIKRTLGWKNFMPEELSRTQSMLRFDIILQHDWPIEQCLLHIRVFFGGKTKSPCFDLFIHWLIKQITITYRNHFSRSYENCSKQSLSLFMPWRIYVKYGSFTSWSSNDGKEMSKKSVTHVQSRCFSNPNPLLFCRTRCRCCRGRQSLSFLITGPRSCKPR